MRVTEEDSRCPGMSSAGLCTNAFMCIQHTHLPTHPPTEKEREEKKNQNIFYISNSSLFGKDKDLCNEEEGTLELLLWVYLFTLWPRLTLEINIKIMNSINYSSMYFICIILIKFKLLIVTFKFYYKVSTLLMTFCKGSNWMEQMCTFLNTGVIQIKQLTVHKNNFSNVI